MPAPTQSSIQNSKLFIRVNKKISGISLDTDVRHQGEDKLLLECLDDYLRHH